MVMKEEQSYDIHSEPNASNDKQLSCIIYTLGRNKPFNGLDHDSET